MFSSLLTTLHFDFLICCRFPMLTGEKQGKRGICGCTLWHHQGLIPRKVFQRTIFLKWVEQKDFSNFQGFHWENHLKVLMKCFFPPEIIGTFTMFNQGQMETSLTDGYNYNAISSPLLPLICKIKQGENHQTAPAQVQNIYLASLFTKAKSWETLSSTVNQKEKSCCLVSSPKPCQIKGKHRTKFRASSCTRSRALCTGAHAHLCALRPLLGWQNWDKQLWRNSVYKPMFSAGGLTRPSSK